MGGPALIKPLVIPSFMSAEGLEHPRCLEHPVARDKMTSSRPKTPKRRSNIHNGGRQL